MRLLNLGKNGHLHGYFDIFTCKNLKVIAHFCIDFQHLEDFALCSSMYMERNREQNVELKKLGDIHWVYHTALVQLLH